MFAVSAMIAIFARFQTASDIYKHMQGECTPSENLGEFTKSIQSCLRANADERPSSIEQVREGILNPQSATFMPVLQNSSASKARARALKKKLLVLALPACVAALSAGLWVISRPAPVRIEYAQMNGDIRNLSVLCMHPENFDPSEEDYAELQSLRKRILKYEKQLREAGKQQSDRRYRYIVSLLAFTSMELPEFNGEVPHYQALIDSFPDVPQIEGSDEIALGSKYNPVYPQTLTAFSGRARLAGDLASDKHWLDKNGKYLDFADTVPAAQMDLTERWQRRIIYEDSLLGYYMQTHQDEKSAEQYHRLLKYQGKVQPMPNSNFIQYRRLHPETAK